MKVRCSNAANLAYCAVPGDTYGIGSYYMRPMNASGLGTLSPTTSPMSANLKSALLLLAIGGSVVLASKLCRPRTPAVKHNPWSSRAKFTHLRVRDPRDFQPGSFRTIDPGRRGHIKAVIGRLRGSTASTTQSVLVPIKDIPARDRNAMQALEMRLESRPAGSSAELRKIVAGVSPKIGRQINKRGGKR